MDDQQLAYRFNGIAASIARVERKVNFILKELKLGYPEEISVDPEMDKVLDFLKKGNRIAALQTYRKLTGAPLEDAYAALEDLNVKARVAK